MPSCRITVLFAVAVFGTALAAKHKPEQAAPVPERRIALDQLGFVGTPTAGLLRSQAQIATLDFIDDDRVLLTFASRPLMRRNGPDEVPVPASSVRDRVDRTIHAEIVRLSDGHADVQQDWRVYDRDPYVLAMGGGSFLLRQGGVLSVLRPAQDGLLRTKVFEARQPIVYAQADVGSGLLVVELEHEHHTEAEHAKMRHDALLHNDPLPVEQADLYGWAVPPQGIAAPIGPPMFHALLPQMGLITGNAQGLVEVSGATTGRFEFYYLPIAALGRNADKDAPRRFLFKAASECRPLGHLLRQDVLLISACKGEADEDYAVNLRGDLLWKHKSQTGSLPDFAVSEDGKRFAVQSVGALPQPLSAVPGEDDFAQGLVQVMDVDTGARLFATVLAPLYGATHTLAISADGRRLAVLNRGALEVYALPPLREGIFPSEAVPPQK